MILDTMSFLIIITSLCSILVLGVIILMLRLGTYKERLVTLEEAIVNGHEKELELAREFQDANRAFWYEKLGQLDAKQLESMKGVNAQIEKNATLFQKIWQSQEQMQQRLQNMLHERLERVSQRVHDSLKEQQEKSAKDFELLSKNVETRLDKINEKVEERLKSGFESIDKTFKEIITGIARINQAQKVIENLSGEVSSLQGILTDKKTRGIFGEVQLGNILQSIFGDKKELYDLQYRLSNGTIVDAVIKSPAPVGLVGVDSKFPLENYRRLVEDKKYTADFRQNIKKHINDIADKYIINGETADIAVMFLPAEAIFAELHAYHEEMIEYARRRGVWIASPTTMMALLTTIMAVVRDIKTQEQAKKIQEELTKLSHNFRLYKDRWEKLSKHIDIVHKDVKDITTTTAKIAHEFDRIEQVDFEDTSYKRDVKEIEGVHDETRIHHWS